MSYIKFVEKKDYNSFNDAVRTKLTEKLCQDPRVQDYMEKKEMYREIKDRVAEASKILKGE